MSVGQKPIIWQDFCQKTAWKWKKLDREWARVPSAPRSANAIPGSTVCQKILTSNGPVIAQVSAGIAVTFVLASGSVQTDAASSLLRPLAPSAMVLLNLSLLRCGKITQNNKKTSVLCTKYKGLPQEGELLIGRLIRSTLDVTSADFFLHFFPPVSLKQSPVSGWSKGARGTRATLGQWRI